MGCGRLLISLHGSGWATLIPGFDCDSFGMPDLSHGVPVLLELTCWNPFSIGLLFRLVLSNIDGFRFDWFYAIHVPDKSIYFAQRTPK